jgi:hypothetical protein
MDDVTLDPPFAQQLAALKAEIAKHQQTQEMRLEGKEEALYDTYLQVQQLASQQKKE